MQKNSYHSRGLLRLGALATTAALVASSVAIMLPGSALADTASVTIGDNTFSPQVTTVVQGSTVTWTNSGTMQHTVTADDGSFDSGSLSPGGTFSQTFNTPGTFRYYCKFHGAPGGVGMSGSIVVTASSASSTTSSSTSTASTSTSSPSVVTNASSSGTTITNVNAVPTDVSATITWTTDTNADSQVAYGTSAQYSIFTPVDSTTTMSHSVILTGLTPNTMYHFSVGSRDSSGILAKSADLTFTTLSSPNNSTSSIPTIPPTSVGTSTGGSISQVDVQTLENELELILQTLRMLISQSGGGQTWHLQS